MGPKEFLDLRLVFVYLYISIFEPIETKIKKKKTIVSYIKLMYKIIEFYDINYF